MQNIQNSAEMSGNVIVQEIRKRIIESVYKSGEKLREKEICDEFGVSRTPVREAFRLLQNEGLLVHLPQRGVQVAEFGKEGMMNIQEVRVALECLSARNAAPYATKEDIEYLKSLNDEILKFDAHNSLRTFDLDKEMHLYIARIGKNGYVAELLENIMMRYQMARYVIPFKESRVQYTYKEHEDIIMALEENNPILAESYMKIHFYRSTVSISDKIQEYSNKIKKEKNKRKKGDSSK